MEQNNEQGVKPIKIERLQQSIDEIDIKINKQVRLWQCLSLQIRKICPTI